MRTGWTTVMTMKVADLLSGESCQKRHIASVVACADMTEPVIREFWIGGG